MKNTQLLHVEITGQGPDVVLIHGFLSSSAYWKKVSEIVAKKNRVIAIDLLGFGKSPKPLRSKYDYEAHIAAIHRTLLHYKITDFTLIGHSMGALIALRYANMYETNVRQLILTNMPITMNAKQAKREYMSNNVMYRLGLTPVIHTATWTIVRSLYRLQLLPQHAMKIFKENEEFVFRHNSVSRFRSFYNVIINARTDIDLTKVRVKTTILSGVKDRKIYLQNLMNNIQLSPHIALETIATGHHIPRYMPHILVKQLEKRHL